MYFFCRIRCLAGKLFYLVSHNRKTFAGLAGSSCFNCGIKGQKIYLIRNFSYCFRDLADIVACFSKLINFVLKLVHFFFAFPVLA